MSISPKSKNKQTKLEFLLYGGIWLCVLLYPLTVNLQDIIYAKEDNWSILIHNYFIIIPFLILFLINTTILVPYVLMKGHTSSYILQVLLLLSIFVGFRLYCSPQLKESIHNKEEITIMPPKEPRLDKDPKELHQHRNLERYQSEKSLYPRPPHHPPRNFIPFPILIDFIIAILLVCVGIGIKAIFNLFRQRERIVELEKEQMREKLDYLKAQLSPHFFMNVLNNIHGMVELNPLKAQKLIIEMSSLLRYVLYESSQPEVPLKNEIEFVNNYISLMRSRYSSKKVSIILSTPPVSDLYNKQIPPLIFIVFIENAFKHGISYRNKSVITVGFKITEAHLEFSCTNSLSKESTSTRTSSGGVGLINVRKRLTLLYGDNYTLVTQQKDNIFNVTLNIPIYENKMLGC